MASVSWGVRINPRLLPQITTEPRLDYVIRDFFFEPSACVESVFGFTIL